MQEAPVFGRRYSTRGAFGLTLFRWTFLEKGINSVMLKLEEGIDMKTVCSLCPCLSKIGFVAIQRH